MLANLMKPPRFAFSWLLSGLACSCLLPVHAQTTPPPASANVPSRSTSGAALAAAPAECLPVNPAASPEARALLKYLYRISGHNLLSGQHNQPGLKLGASAMCEKVNELVGKYPAVWGYDFGFRTNGLDGINNRPAMIAEAIRQHRNGAIITLTWHAVCPLDDEPNEWKKSVWHKMTPEQWTELVTPGTPLNLRWQAQVDVIAGFLKQLRDARVPVLWRPYHEMNGDWFWWCGKKGEKGFKALWQLEYDRFVNHHGLNNLIWVWSANAPGGNAGPYADYFPGRDRVDVLAVDIYHGFKQEFYDDLVALAAGKPVALGEVGKLPDPALLDAQPRWTWFMEWNNMLTGSNPPEAVQSLYQDPRILTRDEIQLKNP
jgi:mannan endo-1,4-beta-mannosidase